MCLHEKYKVCIWWSISPDLDGPNCETWLLPRSDRKPRLLGDLQVSLSSSSTSSSSSSGTRWQHSPSSSSKTNPTMVFGFPTASTTCLRESKKNTIITLITDQDSFMKTLCLSLFSLTMINNQTTHVGRDAGGGDCRSATHTERGGLDLIPFHQIKTIQIRN